MAWTIILSITQCKLGKEIAGLESVGEHVAVMGGLSDRDGEFMLQDALTQPDNGDKEFGRMYKAWRKGDTMRLGRRRAPSVKRAQDRGAICR